MSQLPGFVKRIFTIHRKMLLGQVKAKYITRSLFTSSILFKKVSFNLSDIGEGIREVVVKEWFVKVGDKVSQFDNICEVQSDKASVTITSRYDGVIIKLHYQIDDTALVGQPLVDLETDDKIEKVEAIESVEVKETVDNSKQILETPVTSGTSYEGNTVLCIPSVRRLAKEHSLDLTAVSGTGKHGRVLKEDVLKYLEEPKRPVSSKTQSPAIPRNNEKGSDEELRKVEPIKGFTKAMFRTMTEALAIPHFGYSDEIKVTKLSALRKELKALPDLDVNITFLPFFIKAASNSLKKYPIINSSIDEKCENIIYWKQHNIGVAMATNQGLAVPVIKDVENLTILEIAKELQRLIQSGKNGTFSPSDLSGATFSISNIGIVGGTYTKPVILPPQVAIVAIGMTQILPRFDEVGNVVKEEIINISGSADHRIIDGVSMASFIRNLKKLIETPSLLFLNL
ncbi:lipoamide acyltransferase component of branched-chain alpha-keto acid dehydrogenase complex, mitochondrial isoform X2 [Dendroctonus ponderosae]